MEYALWQWMPTDEPDTYYDEESYGCDDFLADLKRALQDGGANAKQANWIIMEAWDRSHSESYEAVVDTAAEFLELIRME